MEINIDISIEQGKNAISSKKGFDLQYLQAFWDEQRRFGDWQKWIGGLFFFFITPLVLYKDMDYKTRIAVFNSSKNCVAV